MRNLLLALTLLFSVAVFSQEAPYKVVGKEIVKVKQKPTEKDTATDLTYKVKGVDYIVFKSSRGKYYIIRTSKKTGESYKQYLKTE